MLPAATSASRVYMIFFFMVFLLTNECYISRLFNDAVIERGHVDRPHIRATRLHFTLIGSIPSLALRSAVEDLLAPFVKDPEIELREGTAFHIQHIVVTVTIRREGARQYRIVHDMLCTIDHVQYRCRRPHIPNRKLP